MYSLRRRHPRGILVYSKSPIKSEISHAKSSTKLKMFAPISKCPLQESRSFWNAPNPTTFINTLSFYRLHSSSENINRITVDTLSSLSLSKIRRCEMKNYSSLHASPCSRTSQEANLYLKP